MGYTIVLLLAVVVIKFEAIKSSIALLEWALL